MLVAAAVCPHPPLIVPELAAGAAAELDLLRTACDRAVRSLLVSRPDLVVIVGSGAADREYPVDAWGSLAGYGVDVRVSSSRSGPATLPLSLTIGRWLLDRQAFGDAVMVAVASDAAAPACARMGAALAARADRVAMLAMGDGSARRSLKGPGYLDERAEPLDSEVAAALAAADTGRLLGLDQSLAAELLVEGRPVWQVLAGAADDRAWVGELTYAAAPYGVTYLVAGWTEPVLG